MIEQTRTLGRVTDKGKVHAVYRNRNGHLLTDCTSLRINHTVTLSEPDVSVLCARCFGHLRSVPWRTV